MPCDGNGQRTQIDGLSIALRNVDASNDEKLLSDFPCLKKSGGALTVTCSKLMAHWEHNCVGEGSCTTTRGFSVHFIREVSDLVKSSTHPIHPFLILTIVYMPEIFIAIFIPSWLYIFSTVFPIVDKCLSPYVMQTQVTLLDGSIWKIDSLGVSSTCAEPCNIFSVSTGEIIPQTVVSEPHTFAGMENRIEENQLKSC